MQSRRTLLRTAGLAGLAGLTGCIASGNGTSPNESLTTEAPTADPTPTERDHPASASHRLTVESTDNPSNMPVTPSVAARKSYATADSPPVLRVTVANDGDEPVTIGEERSVVFQHEQSEDGKLLLLPHGDSVTEGTPDGERPDYPVKGDGCWRLTDWIPIATYYGTVEIPARGELVADVGCYGTSDASACFPTGTRRFETTYAISPLSESDDGNTENYRWGFSVHVERL